MSKSLRRDEKGASAIEFALAAPAMLMFIIGIAQLGMLCMADAGLRQAVAEGARAANIFPTPDHSEIIARVEEAAWGMQEEHITAPTVGEGTDEDGNEYLEISMSYQAPLNFAFLELDPVTLTEVRRVYLRGPAASGDDEDEEEGGGGGTSAGGTSTGGDGGTSASSSASGGTSSTSASSTSTSSTSTGSTSSTSSTGGSTTTSSSTTSSSSTSSGNGSSGNASSGNNNGSSGHSHGGSSGNGSNGNGH